MNTLDRLTEALSSLRMEVSDTEQRLAVALYRSLATGQAPTPAELAELIAEDEGFVLERLGTWPGVFRDDDGRVVGFWGLSVAEMDHRFTVDGTTTWTWCAWDPLFIAPLLGTDAHVSSTCPVTGEPITLTVGPSGITDLSPPQAVMSMVEPAGPDDVVTEFCHKVLFFADRAAGERWCAGHPGATLIGVEDGFELGQRIGLFVMEER